MTLRATLAVLVLTLATGCSPSGTDVLSAGAPPISSRSGSQASDRPLAAAREACSAFTADQIWDVQFGYGENGEFDGWWINFTPTATDTLATVLRGARETGNDLRFAGLRSAAATLDLLFHGDRSEIGTASEEMSSACEGMPA